MSELISPTSDRRYPFMDSDGGYFYAGTASGGRQVLLFAGGAALFFDMDGNLIGSERRDPPKRRPFRPSTEENRLELDPKVNVFAQLNAYWSTPEGRRSWDHGIREEERIRDTFYRPWLAELGFQPGTIFVKKFDDPVTGFNVADLPRHYVKFLADPHVQSFDDDERAEYPEMIDDWVREGMFVVRVGDYEWLWMDGDGDVNST
jgi:hypothetical protein